jgi:hypothetical protein
MKAINIGLGLATVALSIPVAPASVAIASKLRRQLSRLLTSTAIVVATTTTISATLEQNYALSATISSQIIPSTSIVSDPSFPLNQIADGITSDAFPFNGFAAAIGTDPTGTITLNLVNDFNLRSFILWNDINVSQEGIKDFRLDFFNSSNSQILPGFSTTFLGPIGQVAPAEYVFNQVIPGVRRVDLVVLSTNPGVVSRIEIREVAFTTGSVNNPATSVPEPFTIVGTIIGGMAAVRMRKKLQSMTIDRV